MIESQKAAVPAAVTQLGAGRRRLLDKMGSKGLVAVIFLICFCFCGICSWVIYDTRHAAKEHAAKLGETLVNALSSEIALNIETLNLSIEGVIENLKLPDLNNLRPERRQLILFDRSATARHLSSIIVIREDGGVQFDSRTVSPLPVNLADRDYFQIHKNDASAGLYIGRPVRSRFNGAPVICFSRRLANSEGSFAGVVIGTMRLEYFEGLFKAIALGPNASVTLARTDGIVLIRSPQDSEFIERDANPARIVDKFSDTSSGRFESRSLADGSHRLFTYSQIGKLPILVAIGQTADDIYAQWWPQALTIAALMIALAASTTALTVVLLNDLKRRSLVEAELSALATTDGLTGLANRRTFDIALETQSLLARREASSLALLMIDVDNFKGFNDSFGHQAGDRLLLLLARSIARSLQRPSDLGARYGGDEFVVLLPGSSLAGGTGVAGQIRNAFVTACHAENISAQFSRLSIGVARIEPKKMKDARALVAAADEALYRAKVLGRNRTEVTSSENVTVQYFLDQKQV